MKIAMPIQNPEELEIAKAAGASEVYCGVLTDAWMGRYGAHDSANRRQGLANLQGVVAMRAVGQEARRIGLPAYLTLNARYTGPQYPDLLRLAGMWAEAGGAGVHLTDLGFLHAFVREGFGLRISVSLLSVTLNAHTAAYYAGLGARRIRAWRERRW